ncbi:MAG TPA: type II toxin-antitoxin system RelE/ParE family toxin [bacterium]|nr:type II toxin-antitoxin system RelE/ParE family toxin [bacterium]
MAFAIILAPEAVRDLEKLRANLRAEVRDGIERYLRERPTRISKARIKRLRGISRPQFRLRVRDVWVFYDVVATEVHILAIVSKDQAEEWLRQVGK